MEPVTTLCFYGNEVISGTTGNRIGLHSSIDKKVCIYIYIFFTIALTFIAVIR